MRRCLRLPVYFAVASNDLAIRRAIPSDACAVADVWLRSVAAALPTVRRRHTDQQVRAYLRDVVIPPCETWVWRLLKVPWSVMRSGETSVVAIRSSRSNDGPHRGGRRGQLGEHSVAQSRVAGQAGATRPRHRERLEARRWSPSPSPETSPIDWPGFTVPCRC